MDDSGDTRPHGRRCTARSKGSGKQCKRPAVAGALVCSMHGGKAPQVIAAAERRLQEQRALIAVQTYGLPRDVDPHTALLEELHRTAGHVAWLGAVIADMDKDDLHGPVGADSLTSHPRAEASIWVRLYQEERGHLTKVAKACADVGIEERRVRMAEQAGELLAGVIGRVLRELGVFDDPRAPDVVRREIAALEAAV